MNPTDERRLKRELAAARELCDAQLSKIRKLQATVARLERQLERCRAAVAELVVSPSRVD